MKLIVTTDMKKTEKLFLAALMAAPLATLTASADVKRTDAKPTIDGRLDEAVWATADWEGGFKLPEQSKRGRTPKAQTSFAVLADDEALYFGVKAAHGKMDEMKAQGQIAIWSAEAVEFWLCPDGDVFNLYQFFASHQGLKAAYFYSENGNIKPDPYGPDWDYKIAETSEGWTCEARIPLSAFYMTRGDVWKTTWKANVCRAYRDAAGSDFSCWVDGRGFRDYKKFCPLKGFPVRRAGEDVWMKSAVARATGRNGDGLMGSLDVVVNAAQPGVCTLETDFSRPQTVTLKAGDNAFALPAAFPKNGRIQMGMTLTRTDGSGICRRTYPVLVDYQALRLSFAKPSYRGNFYPGQNADRVSGTVVSAVPGPVEVTLEGPGFGRRTATLPEKGGAFDFDTKGFLDGTALLTVKAGDETLTRKVRKLAPLGEGRHVSWIENGNLVVDGNPVLRRDMYAEYYMGGEAFRRKYDADDLHLSPYTRNSCGTLEPARLLDKGIEMREAINDVKPCAELFAAIDKKIEKGLAGKGVYYYISDEPECRQLSPIYIRHIYDYVCEKDPYHVVLMCSRAGEKYIDCADWFETHPYINPYYVDGKRLYDRPFNALGDFVSAFNPEKHPDKCVGGTATCFAGRDVYPTLTEFMANVWCEFLRGAKTLFPYAYHDLGDRASLYEGIRYLFTSAEALEDILLLGRRETLAKTAEYEAALWTMPDGEKMFCVQNFTTAPLKAEVPGLAGSFTEFRGNRKFDFHCQPQPSTSTFSLSPLESLVATTKKRDAGLATFAETQKLIDRLEEERLSRPNQLLGRQLDMSFATSTRASGEGKMFDGTRDVLAWVHSRGTNGFYEVSFTKFVPKFSEISVYGHNLGGMRVKLFAAGAWQDLTGAKTEREEFKVRLVLDRELTADKLRLEFPHRNVELYEIELPPVGEAPRFNYPRIFGVRPGSPVVFRLPVSGTRPMTFSAEGLPEGVTLGARSGILSGSTLRRGTNHVVFAAHNAAGVCRQAFRLVVGDEIALTPPLGFNTFGGWGAYENLTEEHVRASVTALVEKGLADHGYAFCNVDDGWQAGRGGPYFAMQANGKFDDMKRLGDWIHGQGLKFGLYSTPRLMSYAGFLGGSSDHADGSVVKGEFPPRQVGRYVYDWNDARQMAEWGVDYFKYDWNMRTNAWGCSSEYQYESAALAERMAAALRAQNRDIVLELSHSAPLDAPERFTAAGNMTRTDADLMDVWFKSQLPKSVGVGVRDLWKVHRAPRWRRQSRPGHWNMPCPLRVGMLGGWEGHLEKRPLYKARLTPEEQFSHLSLWCLWASPIIIGAPVDLLDEFTMNLLTNDEMLAVNQDPLGIQAEDIEVPGGEILVKPMEDGDVAVGLFNPEKETESSVTVTWAQAGLTGRQAVRDLWNHADLGTAEGSFTAKVPRHGVVVVRFHAVSAK